MHSKLPNVGTTVFTAISQLAMEFRAINLGQGFPDFAPDPILISHVEKAIKSPLHQYAHMAGSLRLREVLAAQISTKGEMVNPNTEITITAGGTQAIFTAISALVSPGDEVIVIEPLYDSYIPAILVNGAVPILITTKPPNFTIPWDDISDKVNERTKMIIINSPNNPTGKMLSLHDISNMEAIFGDKDITILSDEVYEDIIIGENKHISIRSSDLLREKTISIHSLGKTLGCTGWKIGYAIASTAIMTEFRKVHQFNVFAVNSFLQDAIAAYFEEISNARTLIGQDYTERYQILSQSMKDLPFKPLTTQGSFFQLFDYSSIEDINDIAFNDMLIKKYKVAGIPLSAFYVSNISDTRYIRFCFAKVANTIAEATQRLSSLNVKN